MDVTSATASPTATGSNSAASNEGITSDYQTFLNMMTAQLQNQDPLDPMDSDQFAMQLATFSGVEQQVFTNDLLTAMSGQIALSSMADMSSWVGKEVRVQAPAQFDGTPITIAPNPVSIADKVELVVYDGNGAEVQRQPIPITAEPVEWAGVGPDGQPFPPGQYTFKVESYSGEDLLLEETAEVYTEVTEVRAEGGDILLIVEGGAGVAASAVTGVRQPI